MCIFAQKLNDEPKEPVPLHEDNAADAVGWTYEGVGRAAEPALPSECGVECVKEKEAARGAAEQLAAEHTEAEDLVAVKKEHVIEDARNLKHLMTVCGCA